MRGTEHLHPELQAIAERFLTACKEKGLNVLITDTFRTKAEQNALYAKGRTAEGSKVTNCTYPNSPHNWGVAFDFCRDVKERAYDDSDGFFAKVGAVGKAMGLYWGGDFKSSIDRPHLEYLKYMPNQSCKTLISLYGTPEAFKKTWGGTTADTAPAASNTTVMPTIRRGSRGDAVRILQERLNRDDSSVKLVEDGIFGTLTELAVRAYQTKYMLVVDGIVGPKTWGKLGV